MFVGEELYEELRQASGKTGRMGINVLESTLPQIGVDRRRVGEKQEVWRYCASIVPSHLVRQDVARWPSSRMGSTTEQNLHRVAVRNQDARISGLWIWRL